MRCTICPSHESNGITRTSSDTLRANNTRELSVVHTGCKMFWLECANRHYLHVYKSYEMTSHKLSRGLTHTYTSTRTYIPDYHNKSQVKQWHTVRTTCLFTLCIFNRPSAHASPCLHLCISRLRVLYTQEMHTTNDAHQRFVCTSPKVLRYRNATRHREPHRCTQRVVISCVFCEKHTKLNQILFCCTLMTAFRCCRVVFHARIPPFNRIRIPKPLCEQATLTPIAYS